MKATSRAKYGPVESENIRVGTVDAETPEAKEDDHGLAAWRKKRARGGKVDGKAPKMRLDRRASGGRVKGKKGTTVNVIVAPQGGGAGAPPMGGAGMPPPGPPMPPPKPPMAPPTGMAPPGAGMPPPGPMRKDGGRVHMTASAANGEGRLEKAKAYGKKAKGAAG